jgi:subtilisin family serine protease
MKNTSRNLLLSLAIIATCAMIASSCTKELKDTPALGQNDQQLPDGATFGRLTADKYEPNEILLKFKKGVSESSREKAFGRISGKVSEKVLTKTMQRFGDDEGFFVVHTPLAVLDAVNKMKGIEVSYAEPNFIYQHEVTSNDNYFTNGSLWGMYGDASNPSNQYGSQAAEAWAAGHTGASTVYVGVIDEGAMYNHEDLAGNFGNPKEIAGNGIDDDHNGYVDDHYGWDFDKNDNTTFDGTDDDHGTHVSGTIGAKGGNAKGVAGVNWNVTIISAKFLGRRGGTTANAVKAVDYLTDLKTRDGLNLVATNNSWGGGGYSQALYDAIERANTANILFIAAAGNDGSNIDASASYPAGYTNDNIISVAAIDKNGSLASFSNYGAKSVDLGAPGVGIYSTLPAKSGRNIVSSYGSYSGTSMATPHVTGAAALYASTHSGASAAQIKSAILSSVVPTSSLNNKTVTGGRLNVSGF